MTNVFTTPCSKRQRHHVAVRDVADLVAENRLDLALGEPRQQPRADRDERVVARRARRERVDVGRIVDRDLGVPDAGRVREPVHRVLSQLSAALRGVSMTCAPVDILAIHFEIANEINEPEKPTTAENTSSAPRSSCVPFSVRMRSTPRTLSTT